MKLSKITAAIAATVVAASAQAETISGGGLDTVDTGQAGGAGTAVSAVAVIGSTQLLDGLRDMQGFPAACAGNLSVLCAPSISSAELRAILTNAVVNPSSVLNDVTDLGTASGITGKGSNFTEHAAAGVLDALNAFNGSGVIDGFSCGQGAALVLSNGASANDASTIAAQSGAALGFIHATELDNSVGFIKLDGVAPSAFALVSSNYNLVSNLTTDNGVLDSSTNGITVGVVAAGPGVASHASAACAPITTESAIADVDGGSV